MENGVKIGDLFYTSWGYEQTNVDFFQVVAVKGKTSVLVRQVRPQLAEDNPVSGMSSDRRYKLPAPGELLPPSSYSSFIQDNEHGDLKRVTLGWNDEPRIKVGRAGGYQTTATPYHGQKVYESRYA